MSIHSSTSPTLLNENHILAKHNMHLLTDNIDHLSYGLLAFLKNVGKEEFDDELECKEEIQLDPIKMDSPSNDKEHDLNCQDETINQPLALTPVPTEKHKVLMTPTKEPMSNELSGSGSSRLPNIDEREFSPF